MSHLTKAQKNAAKYRDLKNAVEMLHRIYGDIVMCGQLADEYDVQRTSDENARLYIDELSKSFSVELAKTFTELGTKEE